MVIPIRDVLRMERAGRTEVQFVKDRDGGITSATTKPAR